MQWKKRVEVHTKEHNISSFSHRNFEGQERMEWYIQNMERKNCQLRILYLEELPLSNG